MDLWKEYEKRYPNDFLNVDGIVEPSTYNKQTKKILFILKETNQLYEPLVDFLNRGAPDGGKITWQPICKWIEALLDGTKNNNYSTAEERARILKRIATMNIKKSPGESTSDSSYLKWAEENTDLLLTQINEINPDIIIVCCSTNESIAINRILFSEADTQKFKDTDLWYTKRNEDGFLIYARHPNRAPNSYINAFLEFHKII